MATIIIGSELVKAPCANSEVNTRALRILLYLWMKSKINNVQSYVIVQASLMNMIIAL